MLLCQEIHNTLIHMNNPPWSNLELSALLKGTLVTSSWLRNQKPSDYQSRALTTRQHLTQLCILVFSPFPMGPRCLQIQIGLTWELTVWNQHLSLNSNNISDRNGRGTEKRSEWNRAQWKGNDSKIDLYCILLYKEKQWLSFGQNGFWHKICVCGNLVNKRHKK